MDNQAVVETVLDLLGQPRDAFDFVTDRPRPRPALRHRPTRLRTELGWTPQYVDFRSGLAATIDWFPRLNPGWWASSRWQPRRSTREPKRVLTTVASWLSGHRTLRDARSSLRIASRDRRPSCDLTKSQPATRHLLILRPAAQAPNRPPQPGQITQPARPDILIPEADARDEQGSRRVQ